MSNLWLDRIRSTPEEGLGEAERVMAGLDRLGIDFKLVTAQLENEGIQKFIDPFDSLAKEPCGKTCLMTLEQDGRTWEPEAGKTIAATRC